MLQITPNSTQKLPDLSGVIEKVPIEIITDEIFTYQDLPDLFNLGLVNKSFHELIKNYFVDPQKGQSIIYSIKVTNKLLYCNPTICAYGLILASFLFQKQLSIAYILWRE